jgi:GH15 family glucan-1,4-alpha-glucosidase
MDTLMPAAAHWREPDHGIWEIRVAPRHYLHSKLMCWAAVDRAVRLAPVLFPDGVDDARIARWSDARDAIRRAILSRGWSELPGNFPQAFSHIGLVNAAQAIGGARQRAKPDPKDAVRVRRAGRHGR